MGEQAAITVLYALSGFGALAWLWGLATLRRAAREGAEATPAEADRFGPEPDEPPGLLTGSDEVDGAPAALSRKAAAALARQDHGRLGPIRVVERTDALVRFEGPGPSVTAAVSGVPMTALRRGELRFRAASPSRTRVDYRVEVEGGRWLLRFGGAFQVLGLIALVGGFVAVRAFVVASPDAGVRAQVFQMIQVVHFLWPPFLAASLYRGRRAAVRRGFEAMVANLPYLDG